MSEINKTNINTVSNDNDKVNISNESKNIYTEAKNDLRNLMLSKSGLENLTDDFEIELSRCITIHSNECNSFFQDKLQVNV